jgi:exodeoxyribonuclease VII large subunit
VVTSPTGAAIRDFLNVLHRRHPGLRVVIHPVRVQGKGAAAEIAAAISEFCEGTVGIGAVDVVVVTRGGGSIEDLWEFNEESVARAIASCSVPVVSAVGHEIDFTIADFAADFRAPTPSAAAEILAADGGELLDRCRALAGRIGREAVSLRERLVSRADLAFSSSLFREPFRRIGEIGQTLDRAEGDLEGGLGIRLEEIRNRLSTSEIQLSSSRPDQRIAVMRQQAAALTDRLQNHLHRLREREAGRLARVESVLSALSPEATLRRGFSITRSADGRMLTSASQVAKGDRILTQLADGEIEAEVKG